MSVVANVAINLDARGANQSLNQFQQRATAASRAAEQLQQGTTAAGQAAQIVGRTFEAAANGQKSYIDASGRAQRENRQLVTSTDAVTAGLRRQNQAAQIVGRQFSQQGGSTAQLAKQLRELKTEYERLTASAKASARAGGEGFSAATVDRLRALSSQIKSTREEFRSSKAAAASYRQELDSATEAAQGASGKLQGLGRILASIGAGAIIGELVRSAATFEGEVKKAAAIEGSGSFDNLRKSIEDVAAVAAGTPLEVARLATSLSRAGFSAQETSQALRGIVQGAEATAVPFETMGSIAADTMRSFGIETSKTQAVVDILVKTANSSNQSITDVGEAMSYAASTAKGLGININDLSIATALLADTGIRGSRAGTTLSTGLSRLQRAASGSAGDLLELGNRNGMLVQSMKSLGAEVLDAQGRMKPLDQVIISLKRNFDKMDVGKRTQIANALFGEDAGRGWLSLLNNSEAKIESISKKIRNSGGAAAETQKQMMGFENQMKVLGGNIDIVKNAIGSMITSALSPFVGLVNTAIGITQSWPKSLRDVAAGAAAAGLAVVGFVLAVNAIKAAAAIAGITSISGALASLTTAFGVAGAAAKGFAAALLANPIGLAVAGVAALTVAAYNLNEPFKQFVDTIPQRFGAFWDSLANDAAFTIDRVTKIWEGLRDTVGGVIRAIQDKWIQFARFFAGIWDNIKNLAGNALAAIGVDANGLASSMASIAGSIQSLWSAAFGSIAGGWRQAVADMINSINPLFRILKATGVADVGGAAAKAWFGDFKATTAGGKISAKVPSPNVIAPVDPPKGATPGDGGGAAAADVKKAAADAKKAASGKTDAQRAAERAAEQEQQIQDRLRGINLETAGMKQLGILKDLQLQAEMDGNKEQQIQLQLEENLLNIRQRLAQSLLSESNERIRIAMLTQAEEESAAAQAATAGELIKLEAERKKSFDDITRGMQDQIDLAGPLTEQQRRSLEFEKQIAQWKRDGVIKTEDEISTLRRLNKELEERQKLTSAQRVTVALNETKMQLGELTNVGNMAITSANAIGDAFGQAFKSIASGSASTKEILADFFQSVSNAFLDMAAQIIAKQITMLILQTALKALGATGGIGAPGGNMAAVDQYTSAGAGFTMGDFPLPAFTPGFAKGGVFTPDGPLHAFAKGGVVTAPTEFAFADGGTMRRGLMGEAGAEAIMPLKRTADGRLGVEATIPFQRTADDTTEPTIPFQRSADGSPSRSNPFAALSAASIPFTKSTERLMVERSDRETIAAINNPKPLEVRFESQVINGVEYVTAEQHRKGMAEAADRGRKLTLAELRNSVKTRKMMGLS